MQTNHTSNNVCINGYPYADEFYYSIEEKETQKSDSISIKNTTSSKISPEVNTSSNINAIHSHRDSSINKALRDKVIRNIDTISAVESKNKGNASAATQKALNKAREIKNDTEILKSSVAERLGIKTRPNIKECLDNLEGLKKGDIKEETIRANKTDCSGFIKMIYEDNPRHIDAALKRGQNSLSNEYSNDAHGFQMRLRGAELLRRGTEEVSESDIKEGDLIFFKDIKEDGKKTDYATHVGIVSRIETDTNDKKVIYFIHKSTNGGVVESTLDSKARVNQTIRYKDLSPTYGRIN